MKENSEAELCIEWSSHPRCCCVCSREFSTNKKLKKHYKRKHVDHELLYCLFCDFTSTHLLVMGQHKKGAHPGSRISCHKCSFSTRRWKRWVQHLASSSHDIGTAEIVEACRENTLREVTETMDTSHNLPVNLPESDTEMSASQNTGTSKVLKSKKRRNITYNSDLGTYKDRTTPDKLMSTSSDYSITPHKHRTTSSDYSITPHKDRTTSSDYSITPHKHRTTSSDYSITPHKHRTTSSDYSITPHKHRTTSVEKDHKLKKQPNMLDKFRCEQCGKMYMHKCSLVLHMRVHASEKPFICSQCDYSCKFKHHLEAHNQGHHQHVSPHHCKLCNQSFRRKSGLSNHMRAHSGERPIACQYCEYTTITISNLEQHLRSHMGTKPYKCDHCDYRTSYRSNLAYHSVTHKEERAFPCPDCGRGFKRRDHLQYHLRAKHSDN